MTKSYNSPLHHCDFNAIVDGGTKGNGVKTGLSVTEDSPQGMDVDVAAGTAIINNVEYTEVSIINLVIDTAHATLPRKDIIIYDVATTNPAVIAGIAATEPIPPDIPNGDILLAVVNIAAAVTVITNSDIEDGRVMVDEPNYHSDSHKSGGSDIVHLGNVIANVGVFSGTSPTTSTDLDLSSWVGSQRCLVSIHINCNGSAGATLFRTNGVSQNMSNTDGVQCVNPSLSKDPVIIVMTDVNGIVEWYTDVAVATVLTLQWSIVM